MEVISYKRGLKSDKAKNVTRGGPLLLDKLLGGQILMQRRLKKKKKGACYTPKMCMLYGS